ncbi:MAG TPA: hypothetical protein VFY65_09055 [Longimicrobium sp.]|nr:hypothetical protein [Longimicrobium sp.]
MTPARDPAAPAPRIRVHIGRLVLDGIDLGPADRPLVRAALEAELVRLLGEGGIAPDYAAGGATPRLRAPAVVDASADAASLGRQIANAVYGGIGG